MKTTSSRTIDAAQYRQLTQDIDSGSRGGFYTHLFQYTGSEAALMMAQISSGSGVIGGVAWAINIDIQRAFPKLYPLGGVVAFSAKIAENDLQMIQAIDGTGRIFHVPSETEMLVGAYKIWFDKGLGSFFPGLTLLAINETKDGEYSDAMEHAAASKTLLSSIAPIIREVVGELTDSRTNYSKSIQECLDQNPHATTRTFTAFSKDVTEVIGSDGKSVCVFHKPHKLPEGISELKLDGVGNLTSLDISQGTGGNYIVEWQDANGSHGRDVYHAEENGAVLHRAERSILTEGGGAATGDYLINPDGTLHNQQLVTITADGHVGVTLSGNDLISHHDGAEVKIEANSTVTVIGEANKVMLNGSGIWALLVGSDTQTDSRFAGNTITVCGEREIVTAHEDSVWFTGGTDGSVHGDKNLFVANGKDVQAYVQGSDATVVSEFAGNTFTLSGDRQFVVAHGDAIWFNAGADGSVHGEKNLIVANGLDIQASVQGADTTLVSEFAGNTFTLSGERQFVVAHDDHIWLNAGTDGAFSGDKNLVVANGVDIQASVNGADITVVSAFAGNTFTLAGERQFVVAHDDDIWLTAGTDVSVHGDQNLVVAIGVDIQAFVDGSDTSLVSTFVGNSFTLRGERESVTATGDQVVFTAGADGWIYGSNDVIMNESKLSAASGVYHLSDDVNQPVVPVPASPADAGHFRSTFDTDANVDFDPRIGSSAPGVILGIDSAPAYHSGYNFDAPVMTDFPGPMPDFGFIGAMFV
jgi:co-chaperonin GroES (HSP10)